MIKRIVTGAAAAGLLLTGCQAQQPGAGGSTSAQAVRPEAYSAVEMSGQQVDVAVRQLDDMVAEMMDSTGIPGAAVAVVYRGRPVYAKGFGVADVGSKAAVNADTAFQVASVSKPVSASVVASVVGDGGVAWDDPVVKHLPEFELSDPWVTKHATIGDMFAMRSGLPDSSGDDLEYIGYDRMQIIKRFRYLPLSPFRAQSQYANFSLTAGAESVARAQGVEWERLAADRIFRPLGMSRTTDLFSEFMAQDNKATLHVKSGDAWVANGNREEQAQAPAGQVSTTANDFAKWMIMMLSEGSFEGKQVVQAEPLAEAMVPRILNAEPKSAADRPTFYGYGIGMGTDDTGRVRQGFSGAFSQGAAAHFTLVPSEELGIAVFTNASPIGAAEGLAWDFIDLAETGQNPIVWPKVWGEKFAAALGAEGGAFAEEAGPETGKAALPLSAYVGEYANDYYGPARITESGDGGLLLTIGPTGQEVDLVPYAGNVFSAQQDDGKSVPIARFTITGDEATSLEFAMLQAPGQAEFRR